MKIAKELKRLNNLYFDTLAAIYLIEHTKVELTDEDKKKIAVYRKVANAAERGINIIAKQI